MRLLFTVFALLYFAGMSCGQANRPEDMPLAAEEVIRRVIELRTIEGQMEKQIAIMGDAAAVYVTRVLAGNDPTTTDIDMVLVVLNSSFTDPSAIRIVADREPRTTLLVLQYLDFYAKDSALKKRIADTKKHIQQRYAKYLQDSTK